MTRCLDLPDLQQKFIAERRYLKNVSPATLEWYGTSFTAFRPVMADATHEGALKPALREGVMRLMTNGVAPVSVNTYLRCWNAFLRWMHTEGHVATLLKIPKLPEEKKTVPMLTPEEARRLIAFTPGGLNERRVYTIAMLIMDTGLRIDECLNLHKPDIDLDNLLIMVRKGKGRKQRIIPFSIPMRKLVFKHLTGSGQHQGPVVFSTKNGTPILQRNALRDLKQVGIKVGILRLRFHLLRHHFATNYIRSGGSVALLRKVLGHSSLTTTMLYEHCQVEDLRQIHHHHSSFVNNR